MSFFAANMVAAFDPEYGSLLNGVGCLNHTLQLVIHDGLFSLPSVKTLIEKCRNLAGHANSSTKFYVEFYKQQREIMHKQENELRNIKQDVATRYINLIIKYDTGGVNKALLTPSVMYEYNMLFLTPALSTKMCGQSW